MSYTEPILAALAIMLLSLVGALLFGKSERLTRHLDRFMLPVAVGVFLAVVFFELIPEALHEAELLGSAALAAGFIIFFLLSQLLHTYHHHHGEGCHEHIKRSSSKMMLIGDGIHNIADGIVIASAFLINPAVGIATTLGIALHEVPQEIAEYSILIRSGYTKTKALFLNFLSAGGALLGVLITLFFAEFFSDYLGIFIGLAAGNLLYIAASDLLPELHASNNNGSFWNTFLITLIALILMSTLLVTTH